MSDYKDEDGKATTLHHLCRTSPEWAASRVERLSAESAEKDATLADILRFIDAQAEDEGLWCEAQYASEAYIQRGLRGCHAYIESRIKDGPPAGWFKERMESHTDET